MTNSASRKRARRFWGAMAVMRRSSRWLDTQTRTDSVIRRDNSLRETHVARQLAAQ